MKTIAKLLIFSALFASCERELLESVVPKDGVDVVATKSGESGEESDFSISIVDGSEISLNDSENPQSMWCNGGFYYNGTNKPLHAIYPASCVDSWKQSDNNTKSAFTNLPNEQEAFVGRVDPKALVCSAIISDDDFSFRPAVALVKVHVDETENVKELILEAYDNNNTMLHLAGSSCITVSNSVDYYLHSTGEKQKKSISLKHNTGGVFATGDYYFSAIPKKSARTLSLKIIRDGEGNNNMSEFFYFPMLKENEGLVAGKVYECYMEGDKFSQTISYNDEDYIEQGDYRVYPKFPGKGEEGCWKANCNTSYNVFYVSLNSNQTVGEGVDYDNHAMVAYSTDEGTTKKLAVSLIEVPFNGENKTTLAGKGKYLSGKASLIVSGENCGLLGQNEGKVCLNNNNNLKSGLLSFIPKKNGCNGLYLSFGETQDRYYLPSAKYFPGFKYCPKIKTTQCTIVSGSLRNTVKVQKYSYDEKKIEELNKGLLDDQNKYDDVFPDLYLVNVNDESHYVYKTEEPHICTFGADGTVKVKIGLKDKNVTSIVVRPLAKHYVSGIEDGNAYVYLRPYDRVSVEITGNDGFSWDKKLKDSDGKYITASKTAVVHPLFIFVNPIDNHSYTDQEVKDKKVRIQNTVNLNTNHTKTLSEGGSWRLQGGAVYKGVVNVTGDNANISGYGIIDSRYGRLPALTAINISGLSVDGVILINKNKNSTLNKRSSNITYSNYKVISVFSDDNSYVNIHEDENENKNPGNENDGIDVFGCQNVNISHCFSYSHDDAYTVSIAKGDDTNENGNPGNSYNVLFDDCIGMNVKGGNTFEIGYSTNPSVTNVTYKNVYSLHANIGHVKNEDIHYYLGALAVHNSTPGGVVNNIHFINAYVEDAHQQPIIVEKKNYKVYSNVENGAPGQTQVTFDNIYVDQSENARCSKVMGLKGGDCATFTNVCIGGSMLKDDSNDTSTFAKKDCEGGTIIIK